MANSKYLDNEGLGIVWGKVKERDTSTLTAAQNDATSKVNAAKNELQGEITAVEGNVTILQGYFTNGSAKKAIADKNGKAITISVTYYDSNYEEQELVSMVQSIQFDQIEKMPNEDINFYVIAGTVGVLVGAGIVYLIYKLAKRKTTPKEEDL